jgi:hypothetical protein
MMDGNGRIMTAKDAIAKFVQDGDQLVIGNYEVGPGRQGEEHGHDHGRV